MNFQAYTIKDHPDWAYLQIKTDESTNRTPIHLCCIIDTSASMEIANKLNNVKQSLQFLLDFLGPQDSLSIITFSESAQTILNQVTITPVEKENIRTRISIINIDSNTNLSAGIIQSRDSLYTDTNNIKQGILLLTDGVANLGLTRPTDIMELIGNTIRKFPGTSISCVGYGIDHNVELLQNISTEGGGSYYVVNNLEDVATVFGDILGGLISCTYQQVRVLLPRGVEVKSRYAKHIGEKTEIIIGDLPSGMEASFLVKLPTNHIVVMKGYNLQTHTTIEMTTTINKTDDKVLQTNCIAHYLRFVVLELLEKTRIMLSSLSENITPHIQKINECIAKITEYRSTSEHYLWNILLDELNNCIYSLERHRKNDVETSTIMTQHVGYLGQMRGIAATAPTAPTAPTLQTNESTGYSLSGHTFSNHIQQTIRHEMTSNLTPLIRQQAVGYLHTNDATPNLSPIFRSMNTSGTIIDTLPIPPLMSQEACYFDDSYNGDSS